MSILFDKPNIKEINRKGERVQSQLHTDRGTDPDVKTHDALLDESGRIKSPKATTRESLIQPVKDTFTRLLGDADITIDDAIILQKVYLGQVNRDLTGAPQYVIDAINILTNKTYSNSSPGVTMLTINDWLCIANSAGLLGEEPPSDILDKLSKDASSAMSVSDEIRSQINDEDGSMTGIEMFLFLVKFVVAYSVHMLLGFLCCYFKGLMEFKIKIAGHKYGMAIGNKISSYVEIGERWAKAKLGYPCIDDEPECLNEEDIPKSNPMKNLFPCCKCQGKNVKDIDEPTFKRCVKAVVESKAAGNLGDASNCKPCTGNTEKPSCSTSRSKELASMTSDYLVDKSIAEETEGKTGNSQNIEALGHNITNAKAVKEMTIHAQSGLIKAWDNEVQENVGDENCGLTYTGKMKVLNKHLKDVTKKDITDLALDHLDLDISGHVKKAREDIKTTDIDLAKNSNALGPIKDVVATLDKYLTSILGSIQKFVVLGKSIVNFAVSKKMCCIIYSISFLGNLITMQKLCPNKSIGDYFKYSKDFAQNEDVKRSLAWLKFLKQVIEALMAEFASEIKMTGIGLPFGTLIEILKKALGSAAVVAISTAAAPMDKLIRQLKGSPDMQKILENNCANINTLFDMFQCGLNWIIDNVKAWLDKLFNTDAKNKQLLNNINIKNAQFAFLKALLKIINMLIDLYAKMGDCYTSDDAIKEMVKESNETAAEMYSDTINTINSVNVTTEEWDNVAKNFKVNADYSEIKNFDMNEFDGLTFNIDPKVVGSFNEFLEELQLSADLPLTKLADASTPNPDGTITLTGDDIELLLGGIDHKELIDQMINFVETLTNLPS